MKEKQRIGIIMPCYNTEADQLFEAVESVYAQNLDSEIYEIVIVDDGSTDTKTLEALSVLSNYENVHFIRQSNQGQSAARNTALRYIYNQGIKYTTCLDSDDILNADPDMLSKFGTYYERGMRKLEADDQLAFVYSGYRTFGAEEAVAAPFPFDEKSTLYHCEILVSGIFRTENAIKMGGYDDIPYLEDSAFWVSLMNHRYESGMGLGGLRFPQQYYLYRQHDHGENVAARPRDYEWFFTYLSQKNPAIYEKHYGALKGSKLVAALLKDKEEFGNYSWKRRLQFAFHDREWAKERIKPFVLNRFQWAASVFGLSEDPFALARARKAQTEAGMKIHKLPKHDSGAAPLPLPWRPDTFENS